ncbi:EF-P beta-lysylation protein EpmB [Kaarinaea lacus]
MIPLSVPILQGYDWKNSLSQAIRDPDQLLRILELPDQLLPNAISAAKSFPLRVPLSYINRIKKGDPDDPLLRQILPLGDELENAPGYSHDPVGDLKAQQAPGLLHKYHGRALLVTTGACGIHCRYCFRRNYPYTDSNPLQTNWSAVIDYLEKNAEINEIILSGGDPLSLSDHRLANLVSDLEQIAHLRTLRIHTRLPIVLPQRVNPDLLQWIAATRFNVVLVVHVNHANEIDDDVKCAMAAIKKTQASILNQSVLLKGVNDSTKALHQLSHALFDAHILPYYLHQLDKVSGAAHFAVPDQSACHFIDELRQQLPGYLVPRLVREVSGKPNKTPLL